MSQTHLKVKDAITAQENTEVACMCIFRRLTRFRGGMSAIVEINVLYINSEYRNIKLFK